MEPNDSHNIFSLIARLTTDSPLHVLALVVMVGIPLYRCVRLVRPKHFGTHVRIVLSSAISPAVPLVIGSLIAMESLNRVLHDSQSMGIADPKYTLYSIYAGNLFVVLGFISAFFTASLLVLETSRNRREP